MNFVLELISFSCVCFFLKKKEKKKKRIGGVSHGGMEQCWLNNHDSTNSHVDVILKMLN